MNAYAKLRDLVDALELQNDESTAYFDRETGEAHVLSDEVLRIAEDPPDADDVVPDWEREELALAKRILDSEGDRYVALPSSRDVHEWSIMEAFCHSIDDPDVRARCLAAIHARGAFRHFKQQVAQHGLRDSWFRFRDEALRRIAIDWCEDNEIAIEDDAGLPAGTHSGDRAGTFPPA